MSDRGSIEENVTGNSSENVEGEASEVQTLTQERVNEQIRGLIAPLTHQLEELTRLVQEMVTTQHPDHYLRTDFGTTSGTASYQPGTYLIIFDKIHPSSSLYRAVWCATRFACLPPQKMTKFFNNKSLSDYDCSFAKEKFNNY